MRNVLLFLTFAGVALLAVMVLLPFLGVLVLLVAIVAVVVLAAPLLAKLPWFRDRIVVERRGHSRTVRFGQGMRESDTPPGAGGRLDDSDVIDVEGRELPDKDDK